jgi:hypothetical protein
MDDWDVGDVTDFHGMFRGLPQFNEPIGNWDVSSGTDFVSNDQIVRFDLLCFQFGFRVNPALMCGFSLKEQVLSTKLFYSLFLACYVRGCLHF